MTLLDAATLAAIEAIANDALQDECRVFRPGPATVDSRNAPVTAAARPVWRGACSVAPGRTQPREGVRADQLLGSADAVVELPKDAPVSGEDEIEAWVARTGALVRLRVVGDPFAGTFDPTLVCRCELVG